MISVLQSALPWRPVGSEAGAGDRLSVKVP